MAVVAVERRVSLGVASCCFVVSEYGGWRGGVRTLGAPSPPFADVAGVDSLVVVVAAHVLHDVALACYWVVVSVHRG